LIRPRWFLSFFLPKIVGHGARSINALGTE